MRLFLFFISLLLLFLPQSVQADQTVSLESGFNFVGLIVEGSSPTSDQLFEDEKPLDSIFRFNSTTQEFEFQLKLASGQLFGTAFPLTVGEGYVLKATSPYSHTFTGTEPTTLHQPSLATGFSFIAVPTLSTLRTSSSILESHSSINSIFRWNKSKAGFDFNLRLDSGSLFGESMTLAAGEACFIKSTGSGTLYYSTETTPTNNHDLYMAGCFLPSYVTRNIENTLTISVIGPTDVATGLYYDITWLYEPLDSSNNVISSLVLTDKKRCGPAVAGFQQFTIETMIPNHLGSMRYKATIESGAPLNDTDPSNNSTDTYIATVQEIKLDNLMIPALASSISAINEDFTISGLKAAGSDLASITATIVKGGSGYPCHVISTDQTAGTATFHPWEEAQTAGTFEILLSINSRNWRNDSLEISLKPVIQEYRAGHVFKVLGVGYAAVYLSLYNNGTYNELNCTAEQATVDGEATTVKHMAQKFVQLPNIGQTAPSQREIIITVDGIASDPYTASVPGWIDGDVSDTASLNQLLILSQSNYYYPPIYNMGVGDVINIVNADIRNRSVEIPGLSIDTGQLTPGEVKAITITAAIESAMNFYYYTIDGKSDPEVHTLKSTLLGPDLK